jgi:hypothetical protein
MVKLVNLCSFFKMPQSAQVFPAKLIFQSFYLLKQIFMILSMCQCFCLVFVLIVALFLPESFLLLSLQSFPSLLLLLSNKKASQMVIMPPSQNGHMLFIYVFIAVIYYLFCHYRSGMKLRLMSHKAPKRQFSCFAFLFILFIYTSLCVRSGLPCHPEQLFVQRLRKGKKNLLT